MPGILGRQSLTVEDMAQVPATIGAGNLYPSHAPRAVFVPKDGSGKLVVKRRPATTAVKFVGGSVKRCVAAATNKGSNGFVVPVLACKCRLRSFLSDHAFLLCGEGIPVLCIAFHTFF